jgi:hypothetical protein
MAQALEHDRSWLTADEIAKHFRRLGPLPISGYDLRLVIDSGESDFGPKKRPIEKGKSAFV